MDVKTVARKVQLRVLIAFFVQVCIVGDMVQPKKAAGGPKGKKKAQVFTIDCTKPVDDKIMEIASFEKFLQDKIKVDGKTGALKTHVRLPLMQSRVGLDQALSVRSSLMVNSWQSCCYRHSMHFCCVQACWETT